MLKPTAGNLNVERISGYLIHINFTGREINYQDLGHTPRIPQTLHAMSIPYQCNPYSLWRSPRQNQGTTGSGTTNTGSTSQGAGSQTRTGR